MPGIKEFARGCGVAIPPRPVRSAPLLLSRCVNSIHMACRRSGIRGNGAGNTLLCSDRAVDVGCVRVLCLSGLGSLPSTEWEGKGRMKMMTVFTYIKGSQRGSENAGCVCCLTCIRW